MSHSLSISLALLREDVMACTRCKRLARHHAALRKSVPEAWAKPVPGHGPGSAWLWIIGLAPGAKGAGYTGIPFTRDASGRFLHGAFERVGIDVGKEVFISNAARCVPPANRPTTLELKRCLPFLSSESQALSQVRVVVAMGGIAWKQAQRLYQVERPAKFAHGASLIAGGRMLLASYHVSPLNTQTGRLTMGMLDELLLIAIKSR